MKTNFFIIALLSVALLLMAFTLYRTPSCIIKQQALNEAVADSFEIYLELEGYVE